MTKARDFADIAGAVSGGKIASDDVNISFENITDTGTEGTKISVGTTAQRGSTTGQIRYNTTTSKFEFRDSSAFVGLGAVGAVITSIDDTEVDSAGGGNQTFVITGTGFTTGDIVSFVGSDGSTFNAATTALDSSTQLTAVVTKASFSNAAEPYDVKVTSSTGGVGVLENQIYVDNAPAWTTGSGTVATIQDSSTGTHATLAATDPEGSTVTYSETGATNLTGAGLALNSSTGAITGDPTDVAASTTVSFTGRATAGGKTTDRSFNIIINPTTAWHILGNLSSSGGNALNSAASYLQFFVDPADTNSYSGSGTTVTNLAYALGSDNRAANPSSADWTLTNMTLAGSGTGKYWTDSSSGSTYYLRAGYDPSDAWSNNSTDQLAYCGWWYVKNEVDDSSNALWIFNDGDWSPMAQVGIRLNNGQFRGLRGNSTNIQETLPSLTYTDKWLFVALYQSSGGGSYMGLGFKDDTNLTEVYNGSFSFSTGTDTPYPFTLGARPDTLSNYNPTGTRMGWQAVWGANSDAFLATAGDNDADDAKTLFESIFDSTKGAY